MGASEHVVVEQLVSKHTIEELIVRMNQRKKNSNVENIYANDPNTNDHLSQYYSHVKELEYGDDHKSNIRLLLSQVKLIRLNTIEDIIASSDIHSSGTYPLVEDATQSYAETIDQAPDRNRQVKFA